MATALNPGYGYLALCFSRVAGRKGSNFIYRGCQDLPTGEGITTDAHKYGPK